MTDPDSESDIDCLLIDDDETFARVFQRVMTRRGYAVAHAATADDALARMSVLQPPWVVLDLNLAGQSGLLLIRPLLALVPDCRIVVLTGYASITTAVDAIKLGAVQYLTKPADVDAILAAFGDTLPDEDALADVDLEPMSVDRLEWEHIQRVLAEHGGNISATARALKMHRRTLQRKLAKRPVKA